MATPERRGAADAARPARSTPHLASLIRRSRALDPLARRHWLAVLPHLEPDDRERLRQILSTSEAATEVVPGTDAEVASASEAGAEADAKPEARSSATTGGDARMGITSTDRSPGRTGRA